MSQLEKLGAFYLGREFDPEQQTILDSLMLYDAKDLTTHALCVGMTGSGKTGLCLGLLEEAAIDGVPTLAIDPKGDLGNLLLTFPKLRPQDFRPWIDESEAARKGISPEEHAAKTAALWKKGLKEWGQDGSRIARFRDAVDISIYTPGSTAGLPLTVLKSFAVPSAQVLEDSEALRDKIGSTVSGLLTLLGIDADPIRSREHILLSNIISKSWQTGKELDIAALIHGVQSPPLERIGVIDLESFYPAKERFELAMQLNNLLASPGFAAWMEGDPLDVQRLLWTPEGKPKISILSIAHLSEQERMFIVTLVLNEVLAWVRSQPGSSSLRALLYMDEIFGFFPPTANPPSKKPMLTLLKQARASGLGVVLTTQNPVDLDYKGLSNTGTWFLGRLQTERDKARVIEGLEGASAEAGATFDKSRMEKTLASLKSRVFLQHNVHESSPVLFHTRWALSYLRGPLTRNQIKTLMKERHSSSPESDRDKPRKATLETAHGADRPLLPTGISEYFMPTIKGSSPGMEMIYRPSLLGKAGLHFVKTTHGLDQWGEEAILVDLDKKSTPDPWKDAESFPALGAILESKEEDAVRFGEIPAKAQDKKTYKRWEKQLASHFYRNRSMSLWKCKKPKLVSEPGETEGDFRARVTLASREKRDLAMAKLEKRYKPKLATIQDRIRRAQLRLQREEGQYSQQKLQTAVSLGATVLGALFGRKAASVGTVGRAATTMKGAGRAAREKGDIARARKDVARQSEKLQELEITFQEELDELEALGDPAALVLEEVSVRPRKSDISDLSISVVWLPWEVGPDGMAEEAFDRSQLK